MPQPRTPIDTEALLRLLFGFILLVVIAVLAAVIALGKVEAQSSHGLDTLLGGLLTLTGGFAGWAFRDSSEQKAKKDEDQPPS